jgi:hypothetical protein
MNRQRSTPEPETVFVAMRRQISLTAMPTRQPSHLSKRLADHSRLAAGGMVGLVAAAAAAVTFATGAFTSAAPAYAITTSGQTVTITLQDVGALASLNAKLTSEGIPLQAVPVVAGCTATAQEVDAAGTAVGTPETLQAGSASAPVATLTINLTQPPPAGDTLVVGVSNDGQWVGFPRTVEGTVPNCLGESTAHPRN